MFKQSLLSVLCLGLLTLSACSSDKNKEQKPTQAVETTEAAPTEIQPATQVAETEAVQTDIARQPEQQEEQKA